MAHPFVIKRSGEATHVDEATARAEALAMAKNDTIAFSRHACWSQQGRGALCGELKMEVVSEDMVSHFYAKATAEGRFVCVPRRIEENNVDPCQQFLPSSTEF
jgi:hypothetical protein